MDPLETDRLIRELYEQSLPPVDTDEFSAGVRRKLDAIAISQEGSTPEYSWPWRPGKTAESSGRQLAMTPRPRTRRTRLRVVRASAAVVLLVALGLGSWQMVEHVGKGTPVVVVTDDTAGMSPGATGQVPPTTPTPPIEGSSAMSRGDVARTGVYSGRGPGQLQQEVWTTGLAGGSSTPVIADGVTYIYGGGDDLVAVDLQSGERRWSWVARGDSWGAYLATSPSVADGVVYYGGWRASLNALDAGTGQEKWSFPTRVAPDPSWDSGGAPSTPAVLDGVVYFASNDGYLYAVDAKTGSKRWELGPDLFDMHSSPAISGNLLYLGSVNGDLYAVDRETGEVRWTFTPRVQAPPETGFSPAVADGTGYFLSSEGDLYAVDAATGDERWRYQTNAQSGVLSREVPSLAIADGLVFVGRAGSLYAVDEATGQERWKLEKDADPVLGLPFFGSPTVCGGILYIGVAYRIEEGDYATGAVYALDTQTGKTLSEFKTSGGVLSSLAVSDGVVYFGCNDGHYYGVGAAEETNDTAGMFPGSTDGGPTG